MSQEIAAPSFILCVDPKRCTGCGTCELVCSLTHAGSCWPERSRVRVVTEYVDERSESVPVLCQFCDVPVCRLACPTGATYEDGATGARLVAAEKCIGCGGCVWGCPFGASTLDPVTGVAQRCDLCGGDPRCVKFCPTGALRRVRDDQVMSMDRAAKAKTLAAAQGRLGA